MMKSIFNRLLSASSGFTLAETLVALTVMGLGVGLVGSGIFQSLVIERIWVDDVIATRDIRHADSWLSEDALNAHEVCDPATNARLLPGGGSVGSITVVRYEFADPNDLHVPIVATAHDRTNCCVHAGCIAAACQYADSLHVLSPMGHTLQPTALVHEAFLKLAHQPEQAYRGKTNFKAVAAKAMRHLLVDRARRRKSVKHGGAAQHITLDEAIVPEEQRGVDVIALEEALEKLAGLDERQARIIELRFFGGLSNEETAEILGIARSTVAEDWRMARAWLVCELREAADEGVKRSRRTST